MYADFYVGDQFCTTLKQDIIKRFVCLFTTEVYLALNKNCFKQYVDDVLPRVSDYYAAKVVESGEIERLFKPAVDISYEREQWITL